MEELTIWENGIAAAIFAGYAWGILWAFARAVLHCPPWSKPQKNGEGDKRMTKTKQAEAKVEQLIDLIFGEPESTAEEYDPPKSEWTEHERGFFQAGWLAGWLAREEKAKKTVEAESEPVLEPVFARAYGKPWSPEDQPEPEFATSQEADYGLNEPASFAYLAGHTTEGEYRVERWARGRSLRKHITELEPLVDPEALASFLRQAADETWLEAADCFLADLMNCFSRHLPLASPVRSWLVRKALVANGLGDKLGIPRWKGGGPLANQKEEEEEK